MVVQTRHHPPDEVVVLILPHAVVGMQVCMCLSQAVHLEKVVQQADNGIGPLPCVTGFINEVVDLPGKGFKTYLKDAALSRGEDVYGARLEGVRWVVHLLCHVERVVNVRGHGATKKEGGRRHNSG